MLIVRGQGSGHNFRRRRGSVLRKRRRGETGQQRKREDARPE
jgi:hypothetical protein